MEISDVIKTTKGCTIAEIADRLPDLCGRDDAGEILYLLLRLDKRFENAGDRWFTKIGVKRDPGSEIREAADSYFTRTNRKGELMVHLTKAVAETTGKEEAFIQTVISKNYQTVQAGQMVLNRMKENKDA